jgi:peptidoglycan/LPS O-acetylase OafA/YrhL
LVGALLPLVRPRLLKLPSVAAVAVCVAAFGLYELARHLDVKAWPKPLSLLYSEVFLFAIPYTLLALLGGVLAKPAARLHAWIGAGFLAVFVVQAFYYGAGPGRFIQTQGFKYPPQLYYLAYAIGASFLISALLQWTRFPVRASGRALARLGQQTMWIYLWHILFIELFELFGWQKLFQTVSLNGVSMGFPLYFVSIAGLCIGVAKLQHLAVARWIAPRLSEPHAAGVRRLFTG